MKKASPPTAREVFAYNLRRSRRIRDISQEQLALRAGLSRSYISGIERGERNVSIDNMGILAQTLAVPLKDLVNPDFFKAVDGRSSNLD